MKAKTNKAVATWEIFILHLTAWIMYGFLLNLTHRLVTPVVTLTDTVSAMVPYIVAFYVSLSGFYLLKAQQVRVGILVFVLAFLVLAVLTYAYMYGLMPAVGVVLFTHSDLNNFISQAIWGFIYMFGAAAIYYVFPRLLKREREIGIMEKEALKKELLIASLKEKELQATQEKLMFENAFIRAQINPHFLHNTLNALSSEVFTYSEKLSATINTLAEIMEYAMKSTSAHNDKVPVALELTHLERLLEMYNFRYQPDTPAMVIVKDGEPGMQLIPPMAWVTIAENAMKHGDYGEKGFLNLKCVFRDQFVRFLCSNKKRGYPRVAAAKASHGIGLVNLRKRLTDAFQNNYTLTINETEEWYTVTLTIQQDNY